jgi:hypothetical protein
MNTFLERDAATGILLNGEKGSGKTLLAKKLSIEAAKLGMPTVIVNSAWKDLQDKFNKFIQDITQPCVILFDEFEKTFDINDQKQILTLLDGVYPTKKLFVLTCNDKYRIDSHFSNRPGRIFYMINYVGLEDEFIVEYCNDLLNDKSFIDKIVKIAKFFANFNFDMLKALVEDMNRYNESPQEVMKLLNANPDMDNERKKYSIKIYSEGRLIPEDKMYETVALMSPMSSVFVYDAEYKCDDDDKLFTTFKSEDLKDVDIRNGVFTFIYEKDKLVLTRKHNIKFDFMKEL